MKIDDFKNITHVEPVIFHTDNGRKGSKKRRLTVAATVINHKLIIARSTCGIKDQFRKNIGVSKSLGRLLSIVTNLQETEIPSTSGKQRAFVHLAKVMERFGNQVEIITWPNKHNRKQILQAIDYLK